MDSTSVLNFWFEELSAKDWFGGGPDLDAQITQRFSDTHAKAMLGELYTWRQTAKGRLAEIIVLDQFPRNMFRGTAAAFASDGLALILAQEFIGGGHASSVPKSWRAFGYMPLMHSESLAVHRAALDPFSEPGMENNLKFLHAHTRVLEQFGRYPSRNAALGRQSTDEELAFLKDGPTWGQG